MYYIIKNCILLYYFIADRELCHYSFTGKKLINISQFLSKRIDDTAPFTTLRDSRSGIVFLCRISLKNSSLIFSINLSYNTYYLRSLFSLKSPKYFRAATKIQQYCTNYKINKGNDLEMY